MRALVVAIAAALLLTAVALGATPAPNVKGLVVRSGSVTTCYPGEPCDRPPNATFVLFSRRGHTTRATIGATGAFSVRLVPGLYAVSLAPARGVVTPTTMRVPLVGVVHPRFVQR